MTTDLTEPRLVVHTESTGIDLMAGVGGMPDHDEARRCIEAARSAGVDVDQLAGRLQSDGAAAFSSAWNELLDSIQTKLTN